MPEDDEDEDDKDDDDDDDDDISTTTLPSTLWQFKIKTLTTDKFKDMR